MKDKNQSKVSQKIKAQGGLLKSSQTDPMKHLRESQERPTKGSSAKGSTTKGSFALPLVLGEFIEVAQSRMYKKASFPYLGDFNNREGKNRDKLGTV